MLGVIPDTRPRERALLSGGTSDRIARRSQVQILPPLLEKPRKRGFFVLTAAISRQNFCPTFALTDAMPAQIRGSCELLQARARSHRPWFCR
jgi:hypothetical protein